MKKILRFIFILILILFVGYLILCATSPAEVNIERSTSINAPKAVVWNQMVKLKNYENWSPWLEQDATINSVITGEDGKVGNKSEWTSKNSGSGNMTITAVDGYTMNYDLQFITPIKGTAKCWYKVEGEDGAVVATTSYTSESGFWSRGMDALFVKKMLTANFDRGLELLKAYCESGKAEMPGPSYDITEGTYPATTFATIRKTVKFEDMDGFFSPSYGAIGAAAGDKIIGNAAGIYYNWDEENGQADCAAAFPVSGAVNGMTMVDVPESKAYTLKYTGAYSGLYGAHMAINEHIQAKGISDVMVIEEYISMPPEQTDSNKYVTNIYYLYK